MTKTRSRPAFLRNITVNCLKPKTYNHIHSLFSITFTREEKNCEVCISFLFLLFVLQNMAYPLEFDKGFQLPIQIHTVNKIEKQ